MKIAVKKLLVTASILSFAFASHLSAQTVTLLHTFQTEGSPIGVTLSGDTLYGITFHDSHGLLYSVKTDGTGYTVVHNFATNGSEGLAIFSYPIVSGNTLYGTATSGGNGFVPGNGYSYNGSGTIYKVDKDGSNFAVLYSFSVLAGTNEVNADGAEPWGNLRQVGAKFYGATMRGGAFGRGTIYSINIDGTGFTNLHSFSTSYSIQNPGTVWGLVASGNKLFGTTRYGGANGVGTVFSINTDGTGFTTMHSFSGTDGYQPLAGLSLSGSTLFGTTSVGGGNGNVFKIATDGSDFAVLNNFNFSNGRSPQGELAVAGDTLYGTTFGGGYYNNGTSDFGTVYSVKTDGSGFNLLHSFSGIAAIDGYGLGHGNTTVTNGVLYGTTSRSVFRLDLPCDPGNLTIAQYAGVSVSGSVGCTYRIDYTTDLTVPVNWTPLVTNTLTSSPFLFIDTDVISGSRFYRTVAY